MCLIIYTHIHTHLLLSSFQNNNELKKKCNHMDYNISEVDILLNSKWEHLSMIAMITPTKCAPIVISIATLEMCTVLSNLFIGHTHS